MTRCFHEHLPPLAIPQTQPVPEQTWLNQPQAQRRHHLQQAVVQYDRDFHVVASLGPWHCPVLCPRLHAFRRVGPSGLQRHSR